MLRLKHSFFGLCSTAMVVLVSLSLLCPLSVSAAGRQGAFTRFQAGVVLNDSKITQDNINAVLFNSGYRSGSNDPNCLSRNPPWSLLIAYRWSEKLQLTGYFSPAFSTYYYFNNTLTDDPDKDYIEMTVRTGNAGFNFDFIFMPYRPMWRKAGFQLSLFSGVQSVLLSESISAGVPDNDTLTGKGFQVFTTFKGETGLSAQFGFDASFHINEHVSFTPFRLLWNVPVLRPAFSTEVFRTDRTTRVLSGRNYGCGGLFWYIGAAYHF